MGSLRTRIRVCVLSLSLLAFSGPVLAETALHPSSEHLVDLTSNHWCHGCVVKVVDNYGIMGGFQDHTFRGDWTVNRYELAATVAKTYSKLKSSYGFELPAASHVMPPDKRLSAEHWAFPYVHKLRVENGLMSKLFTTTGFHGDQILTRKELAYAMSEFLQQMEAAIGHPLAIERRAAQLAVDLVPQTITSAQLGEQAESLTEFRPYIESALNRYQFMNLHSDHTFRPDAAVTRYDMAATLCKIFALFEADHGLKAET